MSKATIGQLLVRHGPAMRYVHTFAAVARELRDAGDWVLGYALYVEHGARVYSIFRRLQRDGLLERREEPGGPERGGRARALYRWRQKAVTNPPSLPPV